jgi:hypothetical protein
MKIFNKLLFAALFVCSSAVLADSDFIDFFSSVDNADVSVDETGIFSRSLSEELAFAEQDLKAYYYQLLQGGFFSQQYNNNVLVSNLSLTHGVQGGAGILLRLIFFLEKKNDQDAHLLLKKINKFFFLKMHRLIAEGDLQKRSSQKILSCLADLYGHKIVTPEGITEPFRTVLTKMLIVLIMINDGQVSYASRKETMILHMNKLKQELLSINNTLGVQKIDQDIIKDFTTLVAIHQTRKPMIQPSNYKNFFFIVTICAVLIMVVYWKRDAIKTASQPVINWFAYFGSEMLKGWQGALVELGDGLGQGIQRSMLRPLPEGTPLNPPPGVITGADRIGAGIVRGAAANAQGIVQPVADGLQGVLNEALAPGGIADAALERAAAPGGPAARAAIQARAGLLSRPDITRWNYWFPGNQAPRARL